MRAAGPGERVVAVVVSVGANTPELTRKVVCVWREFALRGMTGSASAGVMATERWGHALTVRLRVRHCPRCQGQNHCALRDHVIT